MNVRKLIVVILAVAVVGTGASLLLSRGQTSRNAAAPAFLCNDSQSNYAIAFSLDGQLLAAAAGQQVLLWNTVTHALVNAIENAGPVESLAFSPDGKTLATAAEPSSSPGGSEYVDLWTVPGGTQTATLNNTDGASGLFPSVAFSPDGNWQSR